MTAAFIILCAIVLVGCVLYLFDRKYRTDLPLESEETNHESVCCGLHLVCEKQSTGVSFQNEIIYYDDEELDAYKGMSADQYGDREIEQFRDILITLLPSDLTGWAKSMQERGIELPQVIKDELIMMIAEECMTTA